MGLNTRVPINEAVYLLQRLEPEELSKSRAEFPALSAELVLGQEAGEAAPSDDLDLERAKVLVRALEAGKRAAERQLLAIRARIVRARRYRKTAQIVALICSSGVLGAIALLPKGPVAGITALLALLASIGTILAEGQEGLLGKEGGDIYQAFGEASKACYEAGMTVVELSLLIKYRSTGPALTEALARAQALCRDLNEWVTRTSGSDPNTLGLTNN